MTDEQKARQIIARLKQSGYEAYLVGGAVRDILGGDEPTDFDVVTNASCDTVRRLFHDRNVAVAGVSFRICIVDGIDVAGYRKSGFDPAGPGSGETARTLLEDLSQRDFTMNAMAFCPLTGTLIDPFGGAEDVKNNVIRFTGKPEDRIGEDPLRMARACRFVAKREGIIDAESLAAMTELSPLLATVAPERLNLELVKALTCVKPSLFFNLLHRIGALGHISPGLEKVYGHDGGGYHDETIDRHMAVVGDVLPRRKPLLRLAGYYHDMGKPPCAEYRDGRLTFIGHEKKGAEMVREEMAALRFSVRETEYVSALVLHHMRSLKPDDAPKTVRRLLKKLADDRVSWKDWLCLKIADVQGNRRKPDLTPEDIRKRVMMIYRELHPPGGKAALSVSALAIGGQDVMNLRGIGEGPVVGEILQKLLEHVLDDPARNNRDELVRFVKHLP